MQNPFRIGERLYFRPIEPEDAPRFVRWMNDPDVHEGLAVVYPINGVREREWIEALGKKPEDVAFMIVVKEGDVPIGSCGLHQMQGPNRKAVFGIAIGEKAYWNQGFGTEALRLLCEYGFNSLNLHRIELQVYEYNARAIRSYEKAGFREEGRKREGRFWNGRYWDVLEMGLLDREYRALERRDVRERVRAESPDLCQTGPAP